MYSTTSQVLCQHNINGGLLICVIINFLCISYLFYKITAILRE